MTTRDAKGLSFEVVELDKVSVTHEPTKATWRFKVEQTETRRLLVPLRGPDLPPTTKGMSVIKKAAFERAVADSRQRGLID